MLDVEGDTQAVRQWLEGAGIPAGAMTDGPGKVVVTAGSVERGWAWALLDQVVPGACGGRLRQGPERAMGLLEPVQNLFVAGLE